MKEKQTLFVPMQVHAMCVGANESAQKGSYFCPPTAEYNGNREDMVKGRYVSGAFTTATMTRDDLYGVHLHWFIPDALAHILDGADKNSIVRQVFPKHWFSGDLQSSESGSINNTDIADHAFPVVPNRWLVTRVHVTNTEGTESHHDSRSWIIESDRLLTEQQYYKIDQDSQDQVSTTIPWLEDDTGIRYLGRARPLENWLGEDTDAERFPRLTIIGPGDPSFSLYYPNCRNIFAFHDDLSDRKHYNPEQCQLKYIVIGWYANAQEDPLTLAYNAKKVAELLELFNWTVDKHIDVANIAHSMYCGMIQDVQWNSERAYISRKFESNQAVSIAIGNRVSDGLSALLAGLSGSDDQERCGRLLDALQVGHLDKLDKLDAMAEFGKNLHKNTFTPENGGDLWRIKAKDSTAQDVLTPDDENLAVQLDALNRRQSQLNQMIYQSQAKKQQTFLDWYKYMYFKYDADTNTMLRKDKHISDEMFRKFLEPDNDLDKQINELYVQINTLAHNLNRHLNEKFALEKDWLAPRFFSPNDPVILLSGNALQPSLEYTPGQSLPCRTEKRLQSFLALNSTITLAENAQELVENGSLPGNVITMLEKLLAMTSEHERTMNEMSAEQSFTELMISNFWRCPWNPVFMHWNIAYQPLTDMGIKKDQDFPEDWISSQFQLSDSGLDLTIKKEAKIRFSESEYQGISILTPNAIQNFAQLAQSYLQGISQQHEIAEALKVLKSTPVLSQSLTGFHDALLMRSSELLFPINEPAIDESAKSFQQRIREFVGMYDQYAPNPLKSFNPVRAGWMKIEKLRVVDTFGQYRDIEIKPEHIYMAQGLNKQSDDKTGFFLPPRLGQPSRLQLRWLSTAKAVQESNEQPATTPVCGWIVANFLAQSLMIYNAQGTPLGELRSWEKIHTSFRSSPGKMPEFNIHYQGNADFEIQLKQAIPDNSYLKNFIKSLLQQDNDYLQAFIKVLDKSLADVEPESTQAFNIRGLLAGRPIAITRISLKLDLKGLPAVNQGWDALIKDIVNPEQSARECNRFTHIKFPARIGNAKEYNEYNDGLIGYFRQQEDNGDYDYSRFYCYQYDTAGNRHIVNPATNSIALTADKNTPALTFLVLMDPRGRLNVTSGILPKKSIELPAIHYKEFYDALDMDFLTSPVLHHMQDSTQKQEAVMDLPLHFEGEYYWRWIGKEGESWQEKSVTSDKTMPLSQSPIMISEGWLKLIKNDEENDT